jgi:TetR/AcrR family transcriptional regulator, transcriptional repressor of aconitase
MPKVTQEHLDARRAQILDGARRAFAEHGYEGATVARLEEATGLSRGAIFHYFEDKQDLFVALAYDTNRRIGDVLADRGLEATIRAVAEESPDWLGVLIEVEGKLRHDPEFVRRMEVRSDAGRFTEWFERRQKEGAVREDVPALELARFAASLINGLALRVAGQDPFDVDTTLRLLNDALAPR